MSDTWKGPDLRSEVESILSDMGADLDGLEDWDGQELETLRGILDEEQYEALLDRLIDDGLEG